MYSQFPGGFDGKESTYNEGRLEKHHGQRSLVGYSPWVRKESDATKQQQLYIHHNNQLFIFNIP